MLQSRYMKHVSSELRWACFALVILILIAGSLPSCVGLPQPSGPPAKWVPQEYFYNPDVAGACQLTNYVSGHTISCTTPSMYDYVCMPLDDSRRVQSDVINQCRAWK